MLNTYLCFDDVSKIIRYIVNAKNLSVRELMDMLNQYYQLGSTNNDKIVTLKTNTGKLFNSSLLTGQMS